MKLDKSSLLLSAGVLAFSVANAQTTTTAAAPEELQEVVVTGSRVITNGNDSPTPVTVVTVADIQAAHPASVYEGLLDMPQFGGNKGTAASNPGGAGGSNNNINSPDLRGLGQIRTLVLYDGHRMPPTEQDFLVDANLIPQMLLQRIDVVTGGASAVYGSDAVTGVVNFVTNRNFNGVKFQVRGGESYLHDDGSYDFGVAFGKSLFGGRGHFEGSFETSDDQGIPHRTDRADFQPRWTVQGNCSPTPTSLSCPVPFYLVANATISNYAFGGKIIAGGGAYNNFYFSGNNQISPFTNGLSNGVANSVIQIGGDGAYMTGSSLKAKLGYQQAYGRFDFDVSDTTHFYLTTSGTTEHQFSFNGDSQASVALSSTNAYLPAAVSAAMAPGTTFTFNKLWGGNNPAGDSPVPTQNGDLFVNFLYLNTGLEGSLGKYKWDANYSFGNALQFARQNAGINEGRFLASIDAVKDPSNPANVVCNVTLTNPGLYPGCVPVNLFGPTSESQSAVNYFVQPVSIHTRNRSDDFAASLTGAPVNTWAGPLNMALSGDLRKLQFELSSTALPAFTSPLNCTGLRFNCVSPSATSAGTPQFLNAATANRPPVSELVSEAAYEVDAPVLKDLPFAQAVDVNGAARYARYNITGNPDPSQPNIHRTFNAITWKLGLDWHFNDVVKLRATRSRDFRAPNLNELFSPATVAPDLGFGDVAHGNAVPPNAVVQTSGNANLSPEIAYTSTVGIVLQPTPDFSASFDAYDVKIAGFIPSGANGVSGTSAAFQQVCINSGGTSPYCSLIVRDPVTGLVTKFYSTWINLGSAHTYGVDTELNYKMRLADHAFSTRALIAYQPHLIYTQPGVDNVDAAGTINGAGAGPVGGVVRISVYLRYAVNDHLTADWLTRWRTALHHNTDSAQLLGSPVPYSPATSWSNLTLSYRFDPNASGGQADVFFNIQNIFNQLPHPVSFSGAASVPGLFGGLALGDDPVGRYFTLGAHYKM